MKSSIFARMEALKTSLVEDYDRMVGAETQHPQVNVIVLHDGRTVCYRKTESPVASKAGILK